MKTVFIAGAHGDTGRYIVEQLNRKGCFTIALVKQEDQINTLPSNNVKCIVGDLSNALSDHWKDADAIICAAGTGMEQQHEEADQAGIIRLIEQAVLQGIPRFILISSMDTRQPERQPAAKPFLLAQSTAEHQLEESGLTYTIIRLGELSDEEPAGMAAAGHSLEDPRILSKADAAHAAVLSLELPQTENITFDLAGGDTPLKEALIQLVEKEDVPE
ncbi:NAD(P)H-binding protein [Paenibacillus lemnae]|uniref:NAD(P)H-binding protein n=1 Tax=Paenibacillus lemnae TaxID=1330551 RepID=A0A848M4C2_PAELE|nr:NAD(P)H-binding protein [Paenibacillus lemnae]NMO94514.1 NAD(P)H-binding protein [Paenibacillus lemnae]